MILSFVNGPSGNEISRIFFIFTWSQQDISIDNWISETRLATVVFRRCGESLSIYKTTVESQQWKNIDFKSKSFENLDCELAVN